jgi:stage II sporulation protein AA (anti-sigma F factor antagonist)
MLCTIHGDIDHHNARIIRAQIDDELYKHRPRKLTLDLSRVEFMDSSGLGLILGRVEKADGLNVSVMLTGLSPVIMKLIRLAGLERVKNLTVVK